MNVLFSGILIDKAHYVTMTFNLYFKIKYNYIGILYTI